MATVDEEYLTVDEAAALLRVAASTIRRWIRQGDLPAYRIGHRRVALKRDDLNGLITPARPERNIPHYTIYTDASQIPKLTPEAVQRGLAALERAERHNREIMARRGGKPLRSSVEIIHEMREERMRQLG
jgi:excisionase family DNA binding protein